MILFFPSRFYFTDQTRISSTAQGENTLVQMIGSLYDSIEKDYGSISTRLYRAFRPKPCESAYLSIILDLPPSSTVKYIFVLTVKVNGEYRSFYFHAFSKRTLHIKLRNAAPDKVQYYLI